MGSGMETFGLRRDIFIRNTCSGRSHRRDRVRGLHRLGRWQRVGGPSSRGQCQRFSERYRAPELQLNRYQLRPPAKKVHLRKDCGQGGIKSPLEETVRCASLTISSLTPSCSFAGPWSLGEVAGSGGTIRCRKIYQHSRNDQ